MSVGTPGLLLVILLAAAGGGEAGTPPSRAAFEDPVQEAIRNRIDAPYSLAAAGEALHARTTLSAFYEARGYVPVWLDGTNPAPVSRRLIQEIARSEEEGLRPSDYHLPVIRRLAESLVRRTAEQRPTAAADLELLLTDAFLVLGSHYLAGHVDPTTVTTEWVANRRNVDMAAVLDGALQSGQPGDALRALLPPQPGYARLRQALARYRAIQTAGGWAIIEPGPALRAGDVGTRVEALQARLIASGDLAPDVDSVGVFGPATEAAARRAQQRHGLDIDGVVGAATIAALNQPVEHRIRQLVLNMERWRWLPQDLGDRHVLVNIANFELDVVEGGREVMTMRVAVGRPFRKTPVFSDRISHLVLSPYWHVPFNLAVQDKLPEIQRQGASWFARNNMKVFQGWGTGAREIDPATVDWRRLSATDFPYRLRQEPGPSNALGRVKFMFPNAFNVYLHDTPGREVFARAERAFSSGCIRVEQPMELALYLIGDQGWTRESIQRVVDQRVERTVNLPTPVPVHLLYWTAWADAEGAIHFRRDLYDRDPALAAALDRAPPAPVPGR